MSTESVRPNFIMRLLQYLKLINSLYYDIEINLDNVPIFLINEKSQDSLLLNELNNIVIHEQISIMVEKNDSSEGVESDIQSKSSNTPIPVVLENCEGTRDSNLITMVTNIEKPDISSNLTSDISNSIDFRTDGSISNNNDRKDDSVNSDIIDNNSNIEFCENPLDTYRCSANETILVNTSCENEFISIAPGENVMPESLTNDKFCEELSHHTYFLLENLGFK